MQQKIKVPHKISSVCVVAVCLDFEHTNESEKERQGLKKRKHVNNVLAKSNRKPHFSRNCCKIYAKDRKN